MKNQLSWGLRKDTGKLYGFESVAKLVSTHCKQAFTCTLEELTSIFLQLPSARLHP